MADSADNTILPEDTTTGEQLGLSLEDMAALEFEPWTEMGEGWRPPTNHEWVDMINPHLITLRMAWKAMFKTKPELVAMISAMNADTPDLAERMFKDFNATADAFRGMLTVMDGAIARIACAVSAATIAQEASSGEVQS